VLIIRRVNCINTTSGIYHSMFLPDLHSGRSPTQSYIYQLLIDIIDSPDDDEHKFARNM
jgi:hypothetical protein